LALRYHPYFYGTHQNEFIAIRSGITSPTPFGLLFPSVNNYPSLRVSLEAYDPDYTSRKFTNATATLQTIIPPLTIPTPLQVKDSN
jgi:hypothetical protein